MHYVKQFKINGVDTKQVACVELQGVPNAATEGSVGVLGMDMSSPTHEVYRCVAVNGNIYTWELLSAGMSIISATITGEGGETKSFPYENLRIPNNYLIKVGDLILDSEGYLYQINSIGVESCDAIYCGTHIGGIASGDKDYHLTVTDGKLQMVTESGAIISNIDYPVPDGDTICRDSSTGEISAYGIKTITDTPLRVFVGEQAEYEKLTEEQQQNLFAIITDDPTKEMFLKKLEALEAKKHTRIVELYSAGGTSMGTTTTIKTFLQNEVAPLYYQIVVGAENVEGVYFEHIILPHSIVNISDPSSGINPQKFFKQCAMGSLTQVCTISGVIACEGTGSDYVDIVATSTYSQYPTPRIYIYGIYEE